MRQAETGMRIVLIGFGHVGRTLARILTIERTRFPGLADLRLTVTGIITATRGSLANPLGVDLARALEEVENLGRFSATNPEQCRLDGLRAARELEFDALVELSPLDIERRGQPAVKWMREALERGRHVVTANKGPIAFAYKELSALAKDRGVRVLCESTVMDGAPVFSLAREGLRGCRILALEGILNSTTNFVLGRLEDGDQFSEAVAEAQRRGFAEADPRHDLEGWDAAAKIAVLANVLMDAEIDPCKVKREGISEAVAERARSARIAGRRLKLVCRALGDPVKAEVGLEEIMEGHPFASVSGTGSILKISTDLMTPLYISQQEPDLYDTACGVLGDLLRLRNSKQP